MTPGTLIQPLTLLDALLGETGSTSRTLPGLELWIRLVDNVEGAPTLHDLASSVSALERIEGGENFHNSSEKVAHFMGDQIPVKPILGRFSPCFGTLAITWSV